MQTKKAIFSMSYKKYRILNHSLFRTGPKHIFTFLFITFWGKPVFLFKYTLVLFCTFWATVNNNFSK